MKRDEELDSKDEEIEKHDQPDSPIPDVVPSLELR